MRINILFAVVAFIHCVCSSSFAQRCPASIRTIQVFVRNDHQARDVRYEIIPLKMMVAKKDLYSLEFLWKNFGIERSDSLDLLHAGRSVAANQNYVEKFLATYVWGKQQSAEQGNNYAGRVMDGELTLKASDLNNDLYLLKITSKNYAPSYILGQLLGGCHDHDEVLLQWRLSGTNTK
jgi:hypothetical protein